MVWFGRHWVVALTVVSEVERDAGDECGVGAELVVQAGIVPCAAVFFVPICLPLCTRFPCGEALGAVVSLRAPIPHSLWVWLEWSFGLEGGFTCGGHSGSLSVGQKGWL